MINRIELILKTQNLSPTQFADAIGIQRSSMSHILARRNNPSLDFVMKVLNRFPEINAEWLLTGKNQMLNIGTGNPTPPLPQMPQITPQTPEFEWDNEVAGADLQSVPKNILKSGTDRMSAPASSTPSPISTEEHKKVHLAPQQNFNQNSDIERIIVFFTDGTFKSYVG